MLDTTSPSFLWILFLGVFGIMFYIDLFVSTHRKTAPTFRTGLLWSIIWIGVSLAFAGCILYFMPNGEEKSLEFLAAYLIEKSLSVDNLFVFLIIFESFHIPLVRQPLILKWGIIGAIIMRIICLFLGIEVVKLFHPILYVFGILLIYTAYTLLRNRDEKPVSVQDNPIVRFVSRHYPVLMEYSGTRFFERVNGIRHVTVLFLGLLVVEASDIVFAADSIPAVLAISQDFFIVLTSNLFAILGLRSLYYILADLSTMFLYLRYGVAVILAFVGTKMLIADVYHIDTGVSLGVIITCLVCSILASVILARLSAKPSA